MNEAENGRLLAQFHGSFTPAHTDGCVAQCFAGVQCESIFNLPARRRPQAATLALRMVFVARSYGGHGAPAARLDADRMCPSALCCADGLPPGFLCQRARAHEWKGGAKHSCALPGSVQVKTQDRDNQLCFQPPAQIFIHLGMRVAMSIIACPR